MTNAEHRDYHYKLAARLRSVAETATTSAMKARLLEQAEQHRRIARGEGRAAPELEEAS